MSITNDTRRDARSIVDRHAWGAFQSLPPASPEATQLLREICEEFERRGPGIDDERVVSLGVTVGQTHAELESVALDWLEQSDGAARLWIVAALLYGLWAYVRPADAPLHREGLRRLRSYRRDRRLTPVVEARYVLAIDRARKSEFLEVPDATDIEVELIAIGKRPVDGSEESRQLRAFVVELLEPQAR